MAGTLASIWDVVQFGADKAIQVQENQNQYEIQKQELQYKAAKEKADAARQVALATQGLVTSNMLKNVAYWTFAGGVVLLSFDILYKTFRGK